MSAEQNEQALITEDDISISAYVQGNKHCNCGKTPKVIPVWDKS